MNDTPNQPPIQNVPINDLKIEPGAEDLLDSPAMEPYMNLALSMIKGEDLETAVREIAKLPLEQRYVWRVASALSGPLQISRALMLSPTARRFPAKIARSLPIG